MSNHLLITLDDRVLHRYIRAARRVRRALGAIAPTTEQLIARELAERATRLILDDCVHDRMRRRR